MDFRLKSEQEAVIKRIREFAETEIEPIVEEYDERQEVPMEVLEKCKKLGLFGLEVPRQYGGAGIDAVTYSLIIEEIAKVSASIAVIIAVHNSVCVFPISEFGSDEQKEKYLPKLASGEWIGAFALTEPDAGSDAANIQTSAVKEGEYFVVNGSKIFITNGKIGHVAVVLAKTDPSKGARGATAFIMDKSMDGFNVGTKENKMGMRLSDTVELFFEDVKVPKENVLGEVDKGFKVMMHTLNQSRIGIGAQAIGIAQAALDEAVKYSKERVQFGKPIARFQGIQWMLAEMASEIRAARFSVLDASFRKENGLPFIAESSMAKLLASKVAVDCTRKALQVHGGYGFIKDYKVERLYRDAKVTEIYEGSSEVQKMIIAKELTKD